MLRVRWLGRVPYEEALALQERMQRDIAPEEGYLLLLEHDNVFTLGARARTEHILTDPRALGAPVVKTGRGGDVTYHGPGQLVGYPLVPVELAPDAIPRHVRMIEQVVIDAVTELGVPGAGRLGGFPGVWVDTVSPRARKVCAVGVRVSRGRSMHGFALNVSVDLSWFDHIVPCGIADRPVTSLAAEGVDAPMADVVAAVDKAARRAWGSRGVERQDVVDRVMHGSRLAGCGTHLETRLVRTGVDPSAGLALQARKPPWLRVKARTGEGYRHLAGLVRELGLVTVCEEAGCPNIYECWADGTATFMVNGERCTRRCGFCLVDTKRPEPPDPGEPERVAAAVERMGLAHAVVTTVARDDLDDGGACAVAGTIVAIRRRNPATTVEVLISDCKGRRRSLETIFGARPDVLAHNVETVPRLQYAVRPSAGYARSLGVLAAAKSAGLTTKSGVMVGLGETRSEVVGTLHDLRAVGTDIVTVGQYLRPSAAHAAVERWWSPSELESLRSVGLHMGFAHVEASPLTRSSYHARQAAQAAGVAPAPLPQAVPCAEPRGR